MSRRHDLQSADGALLSVSPFGKVFASGTGAPSNSQAGFAPGCVYVNLTGTAGSVLYVNQGTSSSSTWLNIA